MNINPSQPTDGHIKPKKTRATKKFVAAEQQIRPMERIVFNAHAQEILPHIQWNGMSSHKDVTDITNMFKFTARELAKTMKNNRHVCLMPVMQPV